jgi:hypothetical protein
MFGCPAHTGSESGTVSITVHDAGPGWIRPLKDHAEDNSDIKPAITLRITNTQGERLLDGSSFSYEAKHWERILCGGDRSLKMNALQSRVCPMEWG